MKTIYIAKAVAKSGKTLIGGVKEWQSYPQATREDAKSVLTAYLDGQMQNIAFTSIREIKTKNLTEH